MKNQNGVSPVIGVILMVAVTVALVSLVTVVVLDIGGSTSSPPEPTPVDVQYQSESAINVQILSDPANDVIVRSALGTEYQLSGTGDSVTILNQDGNRTPVAFAQNGEGERSVIQTIPPQSFTPDKVVKSGDQIQPALNNAQDGDIIVLQRDTYKESLTISTNNVTLVGEEGTVLDSPTSNSINVTGQNVRISNIEINGNGGSSTGVNGRFDTTLVRSSIENVGSKTSGGVQQVNSNQFLTSNPVNSNNAEIPDLSATWINVGQADSILIQSETGDNMLIDTGDFSDDGQRVLNYLDKEGVSEIDHLVATHQDADHIGGHESVIQEFGSSGIGNVYDNGVPRSTQTANEYVNAVSNNGLSITEVEQGDQIPFEGAMVEVLNPKNTGDSGGDGSDNDMVVLKVTHGDNAMFFGGDVEADTGSESRIVNSNEGLDVEVMDIPHHGSSTSSSNTLLDALSPEIAVVSAPYDSPFGHPEDAVISRYESRNVDIFWTAANGNVTVTSDGRSITTSAEKGDVNDATKDPNYEISVQSSDSSVEQGSTVNVQFEITNSGEVPDIQDIKMDVSGQSNPVDEENNVKLIESESVVKTLSWTTSNSQNTEDYTITVSTEDDSVSKTVSVTESVLTNSLKNPSFESGSNRDADNWIEVDTADSGRTSAFSLDGSESIGMKDLTGSYGGRILVSDKVSVSVGNSYEFGAHYYLPSNESNFDGITATDYRNKVELEWINDSGVVIGDTDKFVDTSEFDSWNEVNVTGTPPSGAVEARLRIGTKEDNNNNGNIYWDSAFIET